jgi:hypothetical protein
MLQPAVIRSEPDAHEPSMRIVEYALAIVAVLTAGILALVR